MAKTKDNDYFFRSTDNTLKMIYESLDFYESLLDDLENDKPIFFKSDYYRRKKIYEERIEHFRKMLDRELDYLEKYYN